MYENPYHQPYWVTDDVLEHYGILGMKWGVRRYQNPDGTLTAAGKARQSVSKTKYKSGMYIRDPKEDFTIPAKTKMYRMSYSNTDPDSNMYVTTNQKDRNHYKASYSSSYMGVGENSKNLKERVYETTEELRVPSLEKRKAALEEVSKDPKVRSAARDAIAAQFIRRNAMVKVESIKDAKEMLKGDNLEPMQKEVLKAAIKGAPKYANTFVKDIDFKKEDPIALLNMTQAVGASEKVRNAYADVLKKQGYNATVDDFGGKQLWGVQGETTEALIVFNPGKSSTVKSSKAVSSYEALKLGKKVTLSDYKYDAKILGDVPSKEALKIYNQEKVKMTLKYAGGVALTALVPGGYLAAQSIISSGPSKKTMDRLRALEEEKRKNYIVK